MMDGTRLDGRNIEKKNWKNCNKRERESKQVAGIEAKGFSVLKPLHSLALTLSERGNGKIG